MHAAPVAYVPCAQAAHVALVLAPEAVEKVPTGQLAHAGPAKPAAVEKVPATVVCVSRAQT